MVNQPGLEMMPDVFPSIEVMRRVVWFRGYDSLCISLAEDLALNASLVPLRRTVNEGGLAIAAARNHPAVALFVYLFVWDRLRIDRVG